MFIENFTVNKALIFKLYIPFNLYLLIVVIVYNIFNKKFEIVYYRKLSK